ncbi:MAG: VanZ family protein [Prevotella sp.]|nr:VanZ family protein [Prevotella sp.]
MEMLANFTVFIPFGLFISEFHASAKRFSAGRRLGLATLAGFSLSLCIECLQLLLHVGFFELTDLVMNTVGAFVGALISVGVRKVVAGRKSRVIGEGHV